MKILLTDNVFLGAHGSFRIFFDEIECALKHLGHKVFKANDVSEALAICEQYAPDFSAGIGKYNYIIDGKFLCEVYGKPHYQWIIDNPLKMPRFSAEEFTPIFIDREFLEIYEPPPRNFLFLPLGIKFVEKNLAESDRLRGIIFSGQVKDLTRLREKIRRHRQSTLIEQFINFMENHLDLSFILQYKKFLAENTLADAEEFFRLANSYLRSFKRVFVLERIQKYPLILAGDIAEESLLKKHNVVCVGEVPYGELPELFSRYTHVLHISPNFSACVHDRILRGLNAGCRIIAESNRLLRQTFGDVLTYFNYNDFDEKAITESPAGNIGATNKILSQFDWTRILTAVIEDYQRRVGTRENRFGLH